MFINTNTETGTVATWFSSKRRIRNGKSKNDPDQNHERGNIFYIRRCRGATRSLLLRFVFVDPHISHLTFVLKSDVDASSMSLHSKGPSLPPQRRSKPGQAIYISFFHSRGTSLPLSPDRALRQKARQHESKPDLACSPYLFAVNSKKRQDPRQNARGSCRRALSRQR